MRNSPDASDKLEAVTKYLEERLGETVYWECSSDLVKSVDVYISVEDWNELRIPMDEIPVHEKNLGSSVKQLIDTFLSNLSL